MTDGATPTAVPDPRPWWRRPTNQRWAAAMYLVLGLAFLVVSVFDHRGTGLLWGSLWVVGGLLMLVRARPTLADGVLQVPSGAFGRRRVAVAEIEAFALPHPFATTTTPTAVLRCGDRLFLRDVDEALVRVWAGATGVPVVHDPKPEVPPPSRAALS